MQIRKTYRSISPELLFDEVKDFVLKQGLVLADSRMETYSLPQDSSSFISTGTLIFKTREEPPKECLRAHIVGAARGETKLMLDVDESLFPPDRITAFQSDLDFIFGSFEAEED